MDMLSSSLAIALAVDTQSTPANRSAPIFGFCYMDTPRGRGKVFVTEALSRKSKAKKGITLAVESSRIAATHLPGGGTAHIAFKLLNNLISPNEMFE